MITALVMLGVLGAISVARSDVPGLLGLPLTAGSMAYGGWLARRESHRPPRRLVWAVDAAPSIDGHVLQEAQLHWRGPLAFLQWRGVDGRLHRLAWWPDTLSSHDRRELRLAAAAGASTRPHASMAP